MSPNNPYPFSIGSQLARLQQTETTEVELVDGIVLGQTFERRTVVLSPQDEENHTHLIGSTGTGKSKLLELILRQKIFDRSHGFCLLDPHGKLYNDLLRYIAHECPHLADRIILFNPAGEPDNVLGFNPLQKVLNPDGSINLDDLDYRIGTLISGCLKVWGQNDPDKTPRIAKWLENIFYTLLVNGFSLVESAALISTRQNPARDKMLENVLNFLIDEDWETYQSSNLTMKQTQIEGAANRLRRFLSSEILRNILGQQENVLDFQKVMDEGKIILVNLSPQGKLYSENLRLLGVMFVNEIFRVAQLRNCEDPNLKRFDLFIDEFGKFVTRDIANMLEETRKFKVFCTLAHQHLEQLKKEDEYLYASVMANCKTKLIFGELGFQDAKTMAEQIATGYLNLKQVKDEMYQTKVRHWEERRETLSYNIGLMEGQNWSKNKSLGLGYAEQSSIAETEGEALAIGSSDTEGEGVSYSQGRGVTEGLNIVQGITQAIGENIANNFSNSQMEGGSTAQNWSDTTQNSQTNSANTSRTNIQNASVNSLGVEQQGKGSSDSNQSGVSNTLGNSQQDGGSVANNYSNTNTRGVSLAQSLSNAFSQQIGRSLQVSLNEQMGVSRNKSHTDSKTVTKTNSVTKGNSETNSINFSEGSGIGGSKGYNLGYSVSVTPFLAPEEYQELASRTFWSLEEQRYRMISDIKNQATGVCYVKTPNNAPIQIQVEHVESIEYDPFVSPLLIDNVREIAFLCNQEYFKSAKEARREYELRQLDNLSMVISFDGKPAIINAEKVVDIDTEEESPFNRAGNDEN